MVEYQKGGKLKTNKIEESSSTSCGCIICGKGVPKSTGSAVCSDCKTAVAYVKHLMGTGEGPKLKEKESYSCDFKRCEVKAEAESLKTANLELAEANKKLLKDLEGLKELNGRIPIDKDGNFILYAVSDGDIVLSKPEYRDYIYSKAVKEAKTELLDSLETVIKSNEDFRRGIFGWSTEDLMVILNHFRSKIK